MAVETIGMGGEINGYGDSMDAFRSSHEQNTRALLNLAAKRPKNAPLPVYDPDHEDNQWPVMVYHAAHGEKVVGTNLVGLSGIVRKDAEKKNQMDLAQAMKDGFRKEPYAKPQIAVLDPALEKKALLDKNKELEGKLVVQNDLLAKLQERLEAVEKR